MASMPLRGCAWTVFLDLSNEPNLVGAPFRFSQSAGLLALKRTESPSGVPISGLKRPLMRINGIVSLLTLWHEFRAHFPVYCDALASKANAVVCNCDFLANNRVVLCCEVMILTCGESK